MDHGKTLWYYGCDDDLFGRLADVLPPQGFDVRRADDASAMVDSCAVDWFRVLLLDGNVAEPPLFDIVHTIREWTAAVPLIILSPCGQHRLTQIAVARQFGAGDDSVQADRRPGAHGRGDLGRLRAARRLAADVAQVQSSCSNPQHAVC